MARDGFVSWEDSRYGGSTGNGWEGRCRWGQRRGTGGDPDGRCARIAVHPRAQRPGQRFILPGRWEGLPRGDNRPRREAVAVQVPVGEVERRSLEVYEWPWEVQGDRLGTGPSVPGNPRPQAGRRDPGHTWTQPPAGNCPIPTCWPNCWGPRWPPPGTVSDHANPPGPPALPAYPLSNLTSPSSPPSTSGLVRELANLAFVPEASNILLLGPPGVGKTHLAIALALRAMRERLRCLLRPRPRPDGRSSGRHGTCTTWTGACWTGACWTGA